MYMFALVAVDVAVAVKLMRCVGAHRCSPEFELHAVISVVFLSIWHAACLHRRSAHVLVCI